MNKTFKKTLKISGIVIITLLVTLIIGISVIINFIFTSEKLTPIVEETANRSLRAKLSMDKVELTFFSTFPKFGLEITNGALVSKALKDTFWDKTDSLVSFKSCVLEINPIDFLKQKKVKVHQLSIDGASVYAHRSKEGVSNWDIIYPSTTETTNCDTTKSLKIQDFSIDRIRLSHSNVIFDDRNTKIYARLDSTNLNLSIHVNPQRSDLDLVFDNKNILFWQNDELLVNHVSTKANAKLEYIPSGHILKLHETLLSINGIALDVEGTLKRNSLQEAVDMNLTYSLHTPDLKTVLDLIPERFLKKTKVNTKGEVLISGQVKGLYGKGKMPLATLDASVKKASFHYDKMEYGIDNIDLDFHTYIDLMRHTPSYADLKIFRFEGAHTRIEANARANHLLSDPDISLKINSNVNLTALAKTFPLQEGVTFQGKMQTDLKARSRLSYLTRQDYGRVQLDGDLQMKEICLIDTANQFDFRSDAHFSFSGKDRLTAALTINHTSLQSSHLHTSVREMKATVNSSHPQDTTHIANVSCQFEVDEIKGNSSDSLLFFGQKSKVKANLSPQTSQPQMPEISLSLDADTLYLRKQKHAIGMDKGGFGIRFEKKNDSIWLPSGIIGFNHSVVHTPEVKLPIHLQQTSITLKDQRVMLKNAHMNIGKSDLTATGAIYNLYDAIKNNTPVQAQLDLSSHHLDGNQLINALNTLNSLDTDTISDDAPLQLFAIPENIDFKLKTHLDKVTYGKMEFEEVNGAVDVKNQAIYLKNLSMRGLDADMKASIVYHANNKQKGYTGFDFQLEDVNIGKLIDFIPALDSIVPMLRSFKGIVNFDATAEAELDSALNIKIPTLRSAIHIKGDSLVLMDGETFAEISKMMMFKNKKRNLIDSIYVNMTINNGNVTVYPFVVQMDRYRAAVGGTQDLDMNFKYHISVLKSPVPFKLGVNISGNLEKMKFRIGKAKYKDQVTPVAIRKVDSTRMNLGRDIIRDFENVVRNVGKQ